MTTPTTRILLVEDNLGDARLMREALAETPDIPFELVHCETGAKAMDFLAKQSVDVVVCDLGLPDSQRLDTVRLLRGAAPEVPLVVLTGLAEEVLALQALQEGAQDYLVKAQINSGLLWHTLRYAMKRQHAQSQLRNLAFIDDLTGLNNRRGFLALATQHVKHVHRTGHPFLIAFVDVDGMKQINDTYGHQEGNRALADATDVLKESFRQSDILARLGGDEFAVLIGDAGEANIEVVTARIRLNLAALNAMPGRHYALSLSVGIVAAQPDCADLDRLLCEADALMYRQKQQKKTSSDQ
jgi:diguanylate cyclase (GGDEF)-like protein